MYRPKEFNLKFKQLTKLCNTMDRNVSGRVNSIISETMIFTDTNNFLSSLLDRYTHMIRLANGHHPRPLNKKRDLETTSRLISFLGLKFWLSDIGWLLKRWEPARINGIHLGAGYFRGNRF